MPNLTPPNFTLTVGSLNITSLVQQFSLRQNALDIRTPIYWEGTISIAKTKTWSGESLDDFENPSRWARGNHPVSLSFNGTLFATLRIGSYAYNEDLETAQIEVTQMLALLDYKTPPEDYRFFETDCRPVTVTFTVDKLLQAAGITKKNTGGVGIIASIPAPDRTGRGYIELAQEILGERGYWLYHDADETVRIKRINFNATKSFERSRQEIVEWNRQPQRGELVPTLYRVVGGGEKFVPNCGLASAIAGTELIYGEKITQSGYWYNGDFVATTTAIGRAVIERIVTEVIKDTPTEIQIKKTSYQNLTLQTEFGRKVERNNFKAYELVETRFYDDQGRLIKETRRKDGIAYGNYPDTKYDLYPDAFTYGFLESTEINYSHDPASSQEYSGKPLSFTPDDDVIRIRTEVSRKKLLLSYVIEVNQNTAGEPQGTFADGSTRKVIESFYNVPTEKTVETWIEKCPGQSESSFVYDRKVYSRDPAYEIAKKFPKLPPVTNLFLISSLSGSEDDATPPSWSTRPPLCPRETPKLKVEVKRNEPNYSASSEPLYEFTVDINTNTFTASGIDFAENEVVRFFGTEGSVLPRYGGGFYSIPISSSYIYYVVNVDVQAGTFQLGSLTSSSVYNITSAGSGTNYVQRYSSGLTGGVGNRETEYSAQSITTDAEAQNLANIQSQLSMGRAFGYEIVLSLRESTGFLANPAPMQVAWFHNRSFLLDSPSVVFDGREAEVAWEGVMLKKIDPPVGGVSPAEEDLSSIELIFALNTNIALNFLAAPFQVIGDPDLSLITVDSNGDVITSGGFVQALANQNQFAQILVDNNGSVVVDSITGYVVTSANDVYEGFWDSILTVGGEVVSQEQEVLWV
jgi:hypothetical protein